MYATDEILHQSIHKIYKHDDFGKDSKNFWRKTEMSK